MTVHELNPWEVHEFPWGTAVKHTKGDWDTIFITTFGEPHKIDVSNLPYEVILHENGIEFVGLPKPKEDK